MIPGWNSNGTKPVVRPRAEKIIHEGTFHFVLFYNLYSAKECGRDPVIYKFIKNWCEENTDYHSIKLTGVEFMSDGDATLCYLAFV